jgi:hypothetical protein
MLNAEMKKNLHYFGLWCGIGYAILLFLGWGLIAGFLPPPSPSTDIDVVVGFYEENVTSIRIGMIVTMMASALYIPFTVLITKVIERIEGELGIIALTQLLAGFSLTILTFYPAVWWLIGSYRLDADPEIIRVFHDGGWMQFAGGLAPFLFCLISIAVASFVDDSEDPLLPRWVGYVNLWTLLLFIPAELLFFVKSGPFAWNGLISFWIPLSVLGLWYTVMVVQLWKALKRMFP